MKPKILAFAGSSRKDSFNKKILKIAAAAAEQAGAEVTSLDLKDYPLPLFDQDLELAEGAPANSLKLKKIFKEHTGLLIASSEYNSSITPLLKNTVDWVSRQTDEEKSLECFAGKTAAILSASPGALGGLRGLVHLRSILGNIQVLVIPDQASVPQASQGFDEKGNLKDSKHQSSVEKTGSSLAKVLLKLQS